VDYEVKPRVGNWGGRICLPAAPHVQLSVSPGNALRITSFYPRQHSNAVRLSVTFLYCIKMAQHHHIYFLQPGSPIILVLPVFRLSDMRLGHALVFFCVDTGRPLTHVLEVLKYIDRPAFHILATRFRRYAACVGVVDTGYFRRRRGCQTSTSEQLDEDAEAEQLLTL